MSRRFLCGSILSVISVMASEAPAHAGAPGMTTPGATITTVFTRDVGVDFFTTATSNPMGCSMANTFRIQPATPNYSALVSTLLTAYSTHRPVTFWVSACDSDGVSVVLGIMSS